MTYTFTDVLHDLDTIDTTNEPKVNEKAADIFWRHARIKDTLALNDFHTAFDEIINAMNLSDLFDETGKFIHRGVYGQIVNADTKENKDFIATQNALKRLWALQFVDRLK